MGHQKTTHVRPATPVPMKAYSQPHRSAIMGTTHGATIAPMLEPALKTPVANARSFRGNHSATVLIAAGKFPDSPRPSANRAAANCPPVRANAWAAAANDQTISEIV